MYALLEVSVDGLAKVEEDGSKKFTAVHGGS
jgi:hypothetical protein